MLKSLVGVSLCVVVSTGACETGDAGGSYGEVTVTRSSLELASNDRGFAESFHTAGTIDRANPFFTPNGGNGRTCETCHLSNQGWTITPGAVTDLFNATDGLDVLFKTLDEGSRPDNDVSTLSARRKAFKSTLLAHGVTRFPLAVTDSAEFTVTAVKDPSGFSTLSPLNLVIFRRPSPISNEAKVAQTNWAFQPSDFGAADVPTFLVPNAQGATGFHLQNPALPVELATQIRDFQLGLFFAQTFDSDAGALDAGGAKGGPAFLAAQPFHIGINDIQGLDPSGAPFNRKVFDIFDAWANADADHSLKGPAKKQAQAKASIYRGQEIFNSYEFDISGVSGLNDLLGRPVVRGTCSTCHNTPNVGGHSVIRFFDTGTANQDRCLSDYPVISIRNKTTGAVRKVCDLGRAGAGFPPSGHWADVGAFRAPPLRGLAARSPYFHDGQADSIDELINFYVKRFNIHLDGREKKDLGDFLEAL
jgi:cytochrome c peroxidase